jgi:5-formyltetrahydrofolate cyclo-ligase
VSRVRSHISPGPYRSFRELSLAGSVDPVIWCPPTFVGNSGIECSNGHRGFALFWIVELIPHFNAHSPSYPAKAGYPVRRGFTIWSQALWNTRSPAFAGDDSERDGGGECDVRMSETPTKADLRAAALAAREALSGDDRAAAAQAIALRGLPMETKSGVVIAGYSPIRSEIDPAPLMRKLASQGARLALPVITARGQCLRFRVWSPDDRLLRGPLGILEPSPAKAEITPDIVLVPLAAFDRAGHRIGYGAGHYDRTLAQLRKSRSVTTIGLAFGAQQVDVVPALQHDVALDYVLTDTEVFDFRSP